MISRSLRVAICIGAFAVTQVWPVAAAELSACFTPNDDCQTEIVTRISRAQREIRVQAYSFTSAPIAKALIDAHKRGVDVQVILDRSRKTERYSEAAFLNNNGIPVFIDQCCAIAHNKLMVIDRTLVITGSFNFTRAAQERNAENVLFVEDTELAQRYLNNWIRHASTSKPYER